MRSVSVRKRKRPQGLMDWRAYVFDEVEHGTWLYVHAGPKWAMVARAACGVGDSSYVGISEAPVSPRSLRGPSDCGWWFGTWASTNSGHGDILICTPPAFGDGQWSYVNLELDVYRRHETGRDFRLLVASFNGQHVVPFLMRPDSAVTT